MPRFQEAAGPTITMSPDAAPIDYFRHIITDDILDLIVQGTNEHAAARIEKLRAEGKLTDGSRWKKWKSVSRDDIKRAVCHPQHGHHPMPRYGIVLEDAVDVLHPLFHDVMPKN